MATELRYKLSLDASDYNAAIAAAEASTRRFEGTAASAGTGAAAGMGALGKSAEQTRRMQEAFVHTLQDQAATLGKTEAELMSYRAEQLGLGADTQRLIKTLTDAKAAIAAKAAAEAVATKEAREHAAAEKMQANAQQAFLQALKDQAATIGMNSAQLMRYRAAQLGVSEQADVLIDKLHGQGKAGQVSAGQTAAAWRQLPMQLQDVAVSLQGGMNPFTVLMQQGPQVTSAFGGVKETLTAVGGAITPLIAVTTVGAAVAVALGAAWMQGRAEANAYAKALILSGNAIGMTTDQLGDMAVHMDGVAGTQGKAAEVLAMLAGQAGITAEGIERIAMASIQLERVGGPAVEETAKAFADLGRDPLQASIKLNEQTHFLTMSVYEQVRSLEEQGRTTEAAAVTQNAYASAIEQRAGQLEARLGMLEKSWRGLKDAAKETWDAMLDIGREDTTTEKLSKLSSEIDRLQRVRASGAAGQYGNASAADIDRQLAALQAQRSAAEESDRIARRSAADQAAQARQVQARVEWDKQGVSYLNQTEKLQQDIAKIRANGTQAGMDTGEIDKRSKLASFAYDQQASDANAALRLAHAKAANDAFQRLQDDAHAKLADTRTRGAISERSAIEAEGAIEQARLASQRTVAAQQLAVERGRAVKVGDPGAAANKATKVADAQSALAAIDDQIKQSRLSIGIKIEQTDLTQARADAATYAQMWQQAESTSQGLADQISRNLVSTISDPTQRATAQAALAAEGIQRGTKQLQQSLGNQIDMLKAQGSMAADAQAQVLQGQLDRLKASTDLAAQQAAIKPAMDGAVSAEERVRALDDEVSALQLAASENMALAKAIEQVALQRLADERASAVAGGDAAKVAAIDREIAARQKLADLGTVKDFLGSGKTTGGGADMAVGFDQASQSLAAFSNNFMSVIKLQQDYNKAREAAGNDTARLAALDARYDAQRISSYAAVAGAAKGFFKEGTTGYKVLAGAEKAFRTMELAMSIKNAAEKMGLIGAVTTAKVVGDQTQATSAVASATEQAGAAMVAGSANAVAGVANQANGDPYSALPRMAAMAAIMAALGFATGALGGGSGSTPVATNSGTGTVLGDSSAKSESITKSLEHLADVDQMTMRYSAQMAASLRNIEAGIGGLSSLLVRSGNLGSAATGVPTGIKQDLIGKSVNSVADVLTLGLLPGLGQALGGLFGSKTSISGSGIAAGPQTLGSIQTRGLDASYYVDVETKKKMLGFTTSTSNSTQMTDAGAETKRQFSLILGGFADAVKAAAVPLGENLAAVESRVSGFVVDLGKIKLDGLTGTQISETLTAVFGAAGDNIARAALPGLDVFQAVGEGYLQTVVRVASGTEVARDALKHLGVSAIDLAQIANKQGDVAAEMVRQSLVKAETAGAYIKHVSSIGDIINTMSGSAADIAGAYKSLVDVRIALGAIGLSTDAVTRSLIAGAGSLDALQSGLGSYVDKILSDPERLAVQTAKLSAEFKRLGVAMPSDKTGFKTLINGIDATTDAGQELLGQVLNLSDGFASLTDGLKSVGQGIDDEITKIRDSMSGGTDTSLASAKTQFSILTAQARAGDQTAIDKLPQIAQTMLDLTDKQAGSQLELARIQAGTMASLQQTLDIVRASAAAGTGAKTVIIPGFASGGDFDGGLRLVGENGPELEVTGPSRIFSAAQTRDLLNSGGGSDISALLGELHALRQEVAALRSEQADQAQSIAAGVSAVASNTGRTVRVLDRVTQSGDAVTVRAAT